ILRAVRSDDRRRLVCARPGNHQNDLAAHFSREALREIYQRTANSLFVQLGQLARNSGGAVAENFSRIFEGGGDSMWRFIKDERRANRAQLRQCSPARAGARWRKSQKEKLVARRA